MDHPDVARGFCLFSTTTSYVEVQFALPMNVMVVDGANHVARVLVPLSGERTVTVPSGPSLR
jgi:hypothetical protein